MEVVDAIKNRYSVRGFLNKEVEKDTVKKIIELAKMAPSGVNCQPWKIYVVMGDARDSLVAEALSKVDAGKMDKEEDAVYPSERPDWYKARQRAAGFGLYKALGIERDDMAGRLEQGRKNYEFFGAPVGIFITVNKALGSNGWGYVGHMVQTLCLAAVNEAIEFEDDSKGSASNLLIAVRKKFPSNKIIFANGGDRSDTSKILEYDTAQEFNIELKFGIGGNHKESSSSDLLGRWEEYIKSKTKD